MVVPVGISSIFLAAAYYKDGSIYTRGGYKAGSNKETFRGRTPI